MNSAINHNQSVKGVLNADAGKRKYTLNRYTPAEDLQYFIQRYWIVKWDLRGESPYTQVVVSHPNVNLVFERDKTRFYGIAETTSSQTLVDRGMVLGVKFRPGGFYPFWKKSVSMLTGRSISFGEVFGEGSERLEERLLAMEDEAAMIALVEMWFRERLPQQDDNVGLVGMIVDAIMEDRGITKVDDIVSRFGIGKRTMQRLFSRYVGVSPKWVIQRYRLHEAAELVEKGAIPDWRTLSQEMGYFDQAHFIKDFKAIIGKTPEEYTKSIGLHSSLQTS